MAQEIVLKQKGRCPMLVTDTQIDTPNKTTLILYLSRGSDAPREREEEEEVRGR